MDEDVAGLAHVLTGGAFGKCARCGSPSRRRRRVTRRSARAAEGDLLCEHCYRSVVRDEQPVEALDDE